MVGGEGGGVAAAAAAAKGVLIPALCGATPADPLQPVGITREITLHPLSVGVGVVAPALPAPSHDCRWMLSCLCHDPWFSLSHFPDVQRVFHISVEIVDFPPLSIYLCIPYITLVPSSSVFWPFLTDLSSR